MLAILSAHGEHDHSCCLRSHLDHFNVVLTQYFLNDRVSFVATRAALESVMVLFHTVLTLFMAHSSEAMFTVVL